jgi:TusE/DsrC/DsvC family sulfur relay protein
MSYAVDEEGYLVNINDWTPEIAVELAASENLPLSDEHWDIIKFLREYYDEYQIAPAVRVLTKAVGKRFGADKGNSKYLYELFPYGPGKQACKIAGLPKPTGCI